MTPEPSVARRAAEGYRQARRRAARDALLLALPLLLFVLATFIAPIGLLLARSVQNPELPEALPTLTRALAHWNGQGVPDEPAFAALGTDLSAASQSGALGVVARRLNFYQPEMRSLLMRSARNLPDSVPAAWKPVLIDIDARWGEHDTWRIMQRAADGAQQIAAAELERRKIDRYADGWQSFLLPGAGLAAGFGPNSPLRLPCGSGMLCPGTRT